VELTRGEVARDRPSYCSRGGECQGAIAARSKFECGEAVTAGVFEDRIEYESKWWRGSEDGKKAG
jgi:hypothetical protein